MFIVTARIPKKRLLAGAATLACCAVAVAAALVFQGRSTAAASVGHSKVKTNDDRVALLNELGWRTSSDPVLTEELLIPETFDERYDEYLALQSGQGFDLTRYCGKRVKRYTYTITNYPDGQENVQAVLLVYKNRVIGGQIQSGDGSILHGLAHPAGRAAPTGADLL